jgi:hypothetical protein
VILESVVDDVHGALCDWCNVQTFPAANAPHGRVNTMCIQRPPFCPQLQFLRRHGYSLLLELCLCPAKRFLWGFRLPKPSCHFRETFTFFEVGDGRIARIDDYNLFSII